ncbi:MAG TPA: SDR family NAD(P)-dependent oxidoreductase [Streptosporangiaceae bacterium]|nr:SDR family NAD(P)-dependent oxidoreductase [Streptosporangiaceae bacterium]
MEISGKVAIVTGAASGAGRALALGLASRGSAGVAVCDIDGEGAAKVATEVEAAGGRALAIAADVTRESDVQALVARTEERFGPAGLFFSNAGIIVAGGEEASDDAWSKIWAVNVHSHVYVARAVLPGMLARGEGYVVITASAAGLLTQLGSAPYAVTKHAAVAFAEWLSITYGNRGIRVSALCPQAFSSNLLATSRREAGAGALPDAGASGGSAQAAVDGVLTSEQVAQCALDGIATEEFLMLPHPDVAIYERRRADDRDRWLRGMRRLQERLEGES